MGGCGGGMTLPLVADSLAGRMETLALYPFSQSEIHHQTTCWLDAVFAGNIPVAAEPLLGEVLTEAVLRGGYPEALTRTNPRRRQTWHQQYLDALIQRDVQEIANIDKLGQLPLIWASNRLKRVLKSPKLQFVDSGLLASLRGLTSDTLKRDRSLFGGLLETFVYAELLKHTTWAEADYQILYYRDADQYEVDFVVENRAGELIGVEVKASATLTEKDLRGLKRLAVLAGESLQMGIILYDGTEAMPLGEKLWAVPLSSVWGTYPT